MIGQDKTSIPSFSFIIVKFFVLFSWEATGINQTIKKGFIPMKETIEMTNKQRADKKRFINTLAEMLEKYAPKLEEEKMKRGSLHNGDLLFYCD